MMSLSEFIGALTRAAIAEKVGVKPNAVTNAKRRGQLPKSWYFDCCDLAAKSGVACHPEYFGFQSHVQTKRVHSDADIQVGVSESPADGAAA